jgi:hypothetical protein
MQRSHVRQIPRQTIPPEILHRKAHSKDRTLTYLRYAERAAWMKRGRV